MSPIFREDKATQVAARLLELHGGEMDRLKLVKLVYLVDRASLLAYGRPVTYDRFYNMEHGPVVSSTLDCIKGLGRSPYWAEFIEEEPGYRVTLLRAPGTDELSPAEDDLVDSVYAEFGQMDKWALRRYTHSLPEYEDPEGQKRLALRYSDILLAAGWNKEEVAGAIEELRSSIQAERLLG